MWVQTTRRWTLPTCWRLSRKLEAGIWQVIQVINEVVITFRTSNYNKKTLVRLQLFIQRNITGEFHEEVDFDERIRRLQNDFGVDVFFTWGIIEQEGKNSMALVAGGWNDALLVEEGN